MCEFKHVSFNFLNKTMIRNFKIWWRVQLHNGGCGSRHRCIVPWGFEEDAPPKDPSIRVPSWYPRPGRLGRFAQATPAKRGAHPISLRLQGYGGQPTRLGRMEMTGGIWYDLANQGILHRRANRLLCTKLRAWLSLVSSWQICWDLVERNCWKIGTQLGLVGQNRYSHPGKWPIRWSNRAPREYVTESSSNWMAWKPGT